MRFFLQSVLKFQKIAPSVLRLIAETIQIHRRVVWTKQPLAQLVGHFYQNTPATPTQWS